MGFVPDNGRPIPPEGIDDTAHVSGALVPVGMQNTVDMALRIGAGRGMVLCVAGGIASILAPVLSCLIVSLGAGLLGRASRPGHGIVAALVASTFSAVGGALLLGEISALLAALTACALSCASAWFALSGKLSARHVLVLAFVTAAIMVGGDIVLTRIHHTTMEGILTSYYDAGLEGTLSSADIEMRQVLRQTRELFVMYWPTMYFIEALVMAMLARYGARRGAGATEKSGLETLRVPKWVAFALVVGAVAQGIAMRMEADVPRQILVVGANLVSCIRIVLTAQGIGLAWWILERRGPRPFAKILTGLLGAWLEASFVVMSVVGLLDVTLDFRGHAHVEEGNPSPNA